MSFLAHASQTVGPYFRIGLEWGFRDEIAGPGAEGERVTVEGRVLDGDGKPVNDACIEIWQADAHGKFPHADDAQGKPPAPGFRGFGRVPTDDDGRFRFTTIKPGCVPGPGGVDQAPHLTVSVFARGVLKRLATRMYFPDEPKNAADPVLNLVEAERRATLVARRRANGVLEWNVVIQGADETVFFDL